MYVPELAMFSLVWGTALSLRYGHRISVDLDLFDSGNEFDRDHILSALEREFGDNFVFDGNNSNWAIFCYINDIKDDIVSYRHQLIRPFERIDQIRLYSSEDICAMKINAILGRGEKKDFWDLYELLQHYSLSQIIEFHRAKYLKQMLLISIPQAVTYFVDADESEEPISLKGQRWEHVKDFIQHCVNEYLR